MAALEFRDLALLVNLSGTTYIEPTATTGKEGRWGLHEGTNRVHVSSYPFFVLYFNSDARVEDIKTALTSTADYGERHVVYPRTIASRFDGSNPQIARLLKHTKGAWSTREYLVSFIRNEIQVYLRRISDQDPRDYIDPRIETPSGFMAKIPNPVLSFLLDPKPEDMRGSLGIVLAEPGQGKTYMSRYLVSEIAKTESVPLMVDSSQWETMPLEDQSSLLKTIVHSFSHFGATFGWLHGHEDQFLQTTLKADVFRLVFDGFDEYILRNSSVQPMEVLDALESLARTTDTRIVITSRTSFWTSNLSDVEVDDFLKRSGSFLFTIQPFDLEHAKNYFTRRFAGKRKPLDAAVGIYSALRRATDDLVGRGFVLSLVADLAAGGESAAAVSEVQRPLIWLTEALCQREMLRQQLPFTSRQQLAILQSFAVEVAEGEPPTGELLEYSMSVVRPELEAESLRTTLEKLKSHPLIGRSPTGDSWAFRQDQVRILLLAQQLFGWDSERIGRFLGKARLTSESLQDLGAMLVDMVAKELSLDGAVEQIRRIVKSPSPMSTDQLGRLATTDDGSRLAAIVSINAVELFLPKGSSHVERCHLLLQICGPESINSLSFSGTIARFDFAGVHFNRCRFERVAWANCKFDGATIFSDCQFIGGIPPAYCFGLGSAKFIRCSLDDEAEAMINGIRIHEGIKTYAVEDLRADVDSVLRKFIFKGGQGLKTVSSSNLGKGIISASPYRDVILDHLKRTILDEHHISGASDGFHISEHADEALKFYATNNVFTGQLREAFEVLKRRLKLE